jgi:small conductance mechanosensitive channel
MLLAAEEVVASPLTWHDWLAAALIFLGGMLVGHLVRRLIVRTFFKGNDEQLAVEVVGRIVTTVAAVAALLYALAHLGIRLGPLVGALGIGGLAVAFAAQSILANFLSSVILQTRRPFKRGELIRTNDVDGMVEDINFRTVVVRTFAGEKVQVPCAEVLSKPIVNNSTLGRRRTTLELGVGYNADLDKARSVLLKAIAGVDGVRDKPEPEVWVVEFAESGITLHLRFWHAPDIETLWRVRSDVAMAAKRALDQAGITIPFPQRVLHFADSPEARLNRADEQSDHALY